jgi:hypothetical protein
MDSHAHSSPGSCRLGYLITPHVVKRLKMHIVSKITDAALDAMLTQMRADWEVGAAEG